MNQPEKSEAAAQEAADVFGPDADKQKLVGGGAKRGEALQVSEEEDDFEDGRSSGGLTSRSQDDQWARGDVGSRAVEVRAGVLGVEPEDGETARDAAPPQFPRAPEEGRGEPGFRPAP
jgi:hypothetical protein